MAQVELRGVNKSFGKTEVIRNVELEINKGEFVVFVGPRFLHGGRFHPHFVLLSHLEFLESFTIDPSNE